MEIVRDILWDNILREGSKSGNLLGEEEQSAAEIADEYHLIEAQRALIVIILISYLMFAIVYIMDILNPIRTILMPKESSEENVFVERENELMEEYNEFGEEGQEEEVSFAKTMKDAYHRNVIFFCLAILMCWEFNPSDGPVILAFIGLVFKLVQMVGLFMNNLVICKFAHALNVLITFVLMFFAIFKVAVNLAIE